MTKDKVLITGAKGMLGSKLTEVLSPVFDLVVTDREEMDITNSQQVEDIVSRNKPNYIIHCAAYTAVDKAEDEKDVCHKINVAGSANVARSANKAGSTLITISTDYVFDGQKKSPYLESDETTPLSVYGQSKFDGEKEVAKLCPQHYIIRSSWLFGEMPAGQSPPPGRVQPSGRRLGGANSNFVEKIIELSKKNDVVKVVDDQIGSPTYTGDLSLAIRRIIESKISYGIYHFSGSGEASWFDFAKEIFIKTNLKSDLVPIKSSEFPQKAKRPRYSYLSKEKIENALDFKARSWQEMLEDYTGRRA